MQLKLEVKFKELANPVSVDFKSKQTFIVPTYTNVDTKVELSYLEVPRSESGILGHAQPYIRNLGGYGQLSTKDQAVHPEYIKIIVTELSEQKEFDRLYGRENIGEHAAIKVDNIWWAVRDLSLREPGRIKYKDGTLELFLLDNRAPNYGYPIRYKLWSTTNIEDVYSVSNHRVPGGHMYMWDVFAIDANVQSAFNYIWQDPHPVITEEFKRNMGYFELADRNPLKTRLQKLIESITRIQYDSSGNLSDPFDSTGLTWYMIQSWARFSTWNHKDEYYDVGDNVLSVGWQTFGDLMWNDGCSNLHYNFPLTLMHVYLDSTGQEKEVAWWILQRLSKRYLTTSLCWTSQEFSVNHKRTGWLWYEKSGRVLQEVGSFYQPTDYKQYTNSLLMSAELYKGMQFAEEAKAIHLDALFDMNYQNSNGDWGIRILGWGMINTVDAYKYTKDVAFKNLAISIVNNTLNIMKSPARKADAEAMLGGPEPRWDNDLGLPYITNRASNPDNRVQSWMLCKVIIGLIHAQLEFPELNLNAKIKQMTDFLLEELIYQDADVMMVKNFWRPDRVAATYNNGTTSFGLPGVNTAHLAWHNIPLGYCAVIFKEKKYIDAFKRNYLDTTHTIDQFMAPITPQYWEGAASITNNGSVKVSGEFTGVTTKNNLILFHQNFLGVYSILSVSNNEVVIDCNDVQVLQDLLNPTWQYAVAGSIKSKVLTKKDKAIKSLVRNSISFSNQNRPVSWREGLFFNTHTKTWGQVMCFYTAVSFLDKLIDDLGV